MPTDWKIYVILCIAVLIIMAGLVLMARMLRGKIRATKSGITIGDHECTKGPTLERIVTSIDLLLAGQVVHLDWILKQGANGYTKETRDKIAANATAWQEFLIKKGVGE